MGVCLNHTLRYTCTEQYRADYQDVKSRLRETIRQWMKIDTSASWEQLAAALSRIPHYGLATTIRFQQAVGLPAGIILV